MADILEMARDLGRTMARTEEYQALKRAISLADGDREIGELTRRLEELEARVQAAFGQGQNPEQEIQDDYESTVNRLQASTTYQRLVAAQSNFDRVVQRVNQTISKGLDEGAESRIIIAT
jgi:cell fate (sporulation/competence/biofilm development) regulator YlbF (YheA/YmcA/DUF963 family)